MPRTARRSSTSLAKRGSSPALARWKDKAAKAQSSLSRYRRQIKESETPTALACSAAAGAGAALAGAVSGAVGEEVAGVDVRILLGIAGVAGGAALGNKYVIHAGAGPLCSYIYDYTADTVADWMDDDEEEEV